MNYNDKCKRIKTRIDVSDPNAAVQAVQGYLNRGEYLSAIDVLEQLSIAYRDHSTQFLAMIYDIYMQLPDKDIRYHLYQSRHYNFDIKPGEKVLDIGSGHLPFPFATHLSDISLSDHDYGRAGHPFKHMEGKPVYECNIERMPFADKEFDFIYCSHVLEHTENPEMACKELMRVAKRGYIETPSRPKDLFLDTAKISNHIWSIEYITNRLRFTKYTQQQIDGFECGILMDMHVNPQTDREKAVSALILLKSEQVNVMLMWENEFDIEVVRN